MIRIGILGAGSNTRAKHIPLFQKIPGVSVEAVCNRTLVSARKVCAEFGIPRATAQPDDILADPEIDAVVIGTWPYKHCEFTLAALEHGKHVLTEARMARNKAEALRMLAASRARPQLVAQVVPAPFTLACDATVQDLVARRLGKLLAVHVSLHSGSFPGFDTPYHWRQDHELSGNNIMGIGIAYESLMRWVGPVVRLAAQTSVVVRERTAPATGQKVRCEIPDLVNVLGRLARDDAQFTLQASQVCGLRNENCCWLHGTEGTACVDFGGSVACGARGAGALAPVDLSLHPSPGWRVEEEFSGAIRGTEKVKRTTFEDGVAYMAFTDAIHESAATGREVEVSGV